MFVGFDFVEGGPLSLGSLQWGAFVSSSTYDFWMDSGMHREANWCADLAAIL